MSKPRPAAGDLARRVDLGPLAQLVGYHVAQAAVVTTESFEEHIGGPFQLRKVEFSLLMLLMANEALAPKQLAGTLALSAPALTLLLDRLQERGLLRRQPNPADGRSQHVALTDTGRRLARQSAAEAQPMEAALLNRLTRAEHGMLIQLLCRLSGTAPPP